MWIMASVGLVGPFMTAYDTEGEKQIVKGIFWEMVKRMGRGAYKNRRTGLHLVCSQGKRGGKISKGLPTGNGRIIQTAAEGGVACEYIAAPRHRWDRSGQSHKGGDRRASSGSGTDEVLQ